MASDTNGIKTYKLKKKTGKAAHETSSRSAQERKSDLAYRQIAQLTPWKGHNEYFPILANDVAILVADIRVNGQSHPIEIAVDGRVLDGHTRLEALKELGKTTALVRIRHDLGQDEEALKERFLTANFANRQISPLTYARIYVAEKELGERRMSYGEGAFRDFFGLKYGVSGRQLDRLSKLLALPLSIQMAVERREITQRTAEKLLNLPRAKQKAIAARLDRGEQAKDVLKGVLPAAAKRQKSAGTAAKSIAKLAASAKAKTLLRQADAKTREALVQFARDILQNAQAGR